MNGINGMNSSENDATVSKEEISRMPLEDFPGRIVVVGTPEEAECALADLCTAPLIGFDTETRPSFRKGRMHQVALMQLSTERVCYLFRLNQLGFPAPLLNFLQDRKIKKVGLSLRDDFMMMRKVADFEPAGFVDLQSFVQQYRIEAQSLQKIYALLFKKKISKSQRLSNWEAEELTEGQKKYAAIDAWACIRIYNHLLHQKVTAMETNNKKYNREL